MGFLTQVLNYISFSGRSSPYLEDDSDLGLKRKSGRLFSCGIVEGLNGGGGLLVGCRLKFGNFVGSRLKFSIFVDSRLNVSIFIGRRKISVNK